LSVSLLKKRKIPKQSRGSYPFCAFCALDSAPRRLRSLFPPQFDPQRSLIHLGLLEPKIPTEPTGVVLGQEIRGHWAVVHHAEASSWVCRCGRSTPLLVAAEDLRRIRLPVGLQACEICQEEDKSARGKSGRLAAWLARYRNCIDTEQHLYLPADHGFCRMSEEDKNMRTRRFVYEQFWRKPVGSGNCVLVKCLDRSCINPYHLWVSKSPAQKVSEASRQLILRLTDKGVPSKAIQQLLLDQHSLKLSLRSVQLIRSEISKSKSSGT
jgi:hypothetical protein